MDKQLDSTRVAFDVLVMRNIQRTAAGMNVITVTEMGRMLSSTTPHRGVFGLLVELIHVAFQLQVSQRLG